MRPLKDLLPLLLGALLIGAGVGLWQQHLELAEWQTKAALAAKDLARATEESVALKEQAQAAQDQAKSLEVALAVARTARAETAGAVAGGTNRPKAPASKEQLSDEQQVQQWLADAADPGVLRRLNTQATNLTIRRYAPFLQQLNLPPAQNEALVKLLAEKRQIGLDAVVADLQQGIDPTQDMNGYRDLVSANRDSIDSQIHALLGDAGFNQYQDYTRSSGQANVINNLQLTLNNANAPLSPEQAAQLQLTLEDNNTTRINAKVIAEAKGYLSPAQMQALEDLRAIQQANSQKRSQPGQILPVAAPAAKAGK